MRRGLLLIDRGSREAKVREELDTICRGAKAKGGYVFADYCFLEVEPPYIGEGVARCLREEIDSLTIVPYFLYPGRKVKIAVTDVMKLQKDTSVKFLVTRAMSMHRTLVDIVKSRVSSALRQKGIDLPDSEVDVMIIGHGSKDPNAQRSVKYVMDGLEGTYRNVSRCWLEIEQPDIAEGIRRCQDDDPKALAIVFYFLHEGVHVTTDINNDLVPALEGSSIGSAVITEHLGTDQRMIDMVVERAREVERAD